MYVCGCVLLPKSARKYHVYFQKRYHHCSHVLSFKVDIKKIIGYDNYV